MKPIDYDKIEGLELTYKSWGQLIFYFFFKFWSKEKGNHNQDIQAHEIPN